MNLQCGAATRSKTRQWSALSPTSRHAGGKWYVHKADLGYDLVSYGPDDQIRYIEVKGRAGVGAVEISENEWLKAEQLGEEYWLYVVTKAIQAPELYLVQDPAHRLPREEIIPQVRYRVRQEGWHRVAEPAVEYTVASLREE